MALRLTAQYIEVAVAGVAAKGIRVEAQHVEIAGVVDLGTKIRVEAQHIEVAGSGANTAGLLRMTAHYVEVLRANDHRGLTGVLGTKQSGLATDTLQPGAGAQGPSLTIPETTGKVGSQNSLPGLTMQIGHPANADVPQDTGELATKDSILGLSFMLAAGSQATGPGMLMTGADNTIAVTDIADIVAKSISAPAITDIDIDGNWTQTVTSSIRLLSATSTLAMGVTGDHNHRMISATTSVTLQVTVQPGLFTVFASNTLVLVGADSDSGISEGFASSPISLSQSADKKTTILSVDAETNITIAGVVANNILEASATSTITLAQDETIAGPIELTPNNTIAVSDTAVVDFSTFGRVVETDIDIDDTWSQIVDTNIRNLQAITPDPQSDDADDLPTFTDNWINAARLADTFEASTSSTITVTQDLPQPTGKRSVSAENSLTLLDFADNNVKTRNVVSPISLTHTATVFKVYSAVNTLTITTAASEGFVSLQATSIIELEHIARPGAYERFSENIITLVQTITSSIQHLDANSAIPINQDINVLRPYLVASENKLSGVTDDIFLPPFGPIIPGIPFGMSDEVTVNTDPLRNPATLIIIADQAQGVHLLVDGIDLTAESVIGLIQFANESIDAAAETIIDSLQVSAIAILNAEDAPTIITVGDRALFTLDRANLPTESLLTLKHAVGFSLIRDTTVCDYTPFVSESDAGTIPPRPILPEARVPELPGVRFRLAYPPFDTGTTVDFIDMRAPQFGNREQIDATRINRESQGGTLVIFADPIWPEVQNLQMTFAALKKTQARQLLNFLERWLGQEIGIYDHEGRIWKGVITNPEEAVTHDGHESFSANLDIEATRVHQLNRVARTNLGVADVAGQDEALALSAISIADDGDFVLEPVAPGNSPIALVDASDYTKVPVSLGSNDIVLSAFAVRNSFFSEAASSIIPVSDMVRELDFNDFGNLIHNWDAENTSGVSDGGPVPTWGDLGSAPVTLNATVAQEPTARDGVLNNRRVIEFRHSVAVQRMLTSAEVPLWNLANKTGTIFIIMIVREVLGGGNEVVLGNNIDKIFLGGSTAAERPVALLSSEGAVALETPQSVLASGSTQLLVLRRNGNDLFFRRNKVDENGTTFSTNPTPGNEDLYFGGFSGAGNSVDLDMAQVLFYDDILSDEDVLTVEGLIEAKWGV